MIELMTQEQYVFHVERVTLFKEQRENNAKLEC